MQDESKATNDTLGVICPDTNDEPGCKCRHLVSVAELNGAPHQAQKQVVDRYRWMNRLDYA